MVKLAWIIMVWAAAAAGAPDPAPIAAGDEKDLWLVLAAQSVETESQAPSVELLHRGVADPAQQLRRVGRVSGHVRSGGVAASAGQVWLVYEDGSVQSVSVGTVSRTTLSPYGAPRMIRQLPKGTRLRSLAANRRGPWALVQVESADALHTIDHPPVAEDDDEWEDTAQSPVETPEKLVPGAPALPQDRLVYLSRSRWTQFDLPQGWPIDARGWVVFDRPDTAAPQLVSQSDMGQLAVYSHQDDRWQRQDYDVAGFDGDELSILSVDGQLVAARPVAMDGKTAVDLSVLRDGRVTALGTLTIDDPPTDAWAVATLGKSVALVVLDKPVAGRWSGAVWSTMDLQGRTGGAPGPLVVKTISPYRSNPGSVLIIAAISLAMILMFTFARRSPTEAVLKLPGTLVVADIPRRAMAAAIDLAPCVGLSMLIFDRGLSDLRDLWPGASASWQDAIPGLVVIAMNVGHTWLTELFTGKSLGKMLLGMHVASIDGSPPNIWQVTVRNLLRSLDLIAWYALPILMVISPSRQRLGDMVARTVVVAANENPGDPS